MHTNNPPKRSRSPGYDAEIAKTICLRLINRESLRSICADPRMPAKATVCRWLARNQEFRRWYALARAWQVEDFANEILEIANDPVVGACAIVGSAKGKAKYAMNSTLIDHAG